MDNSQPFLFFLLGRVVLSGAGEKLLLLGEMGLKMQIGRTCMVAEDKKDRAVDRLMRGAKFGTAYGG